MLFCLVSKLFLQVADLRLAVRSKHYWKLTFRSSVTLFWATNDPGPTDPRGGTDRVLVVAGVPIVPLVAGLTGDLTPLPARVLRTEAVLALLSLLRLVMADRWLSEVTLEVGTEAGLVAATAAREPILDRGLTVVAVVGGRMVAELTEEARASGFVPLAVWVGLVVVLGLGALGIGAAAGLVVLAAGFAVVLEASLAATGRAGGTGGLVEVLNVLVARGAPVVAGADLGLEPGCELCINIWDTVAHRIRQILKPS